MATIASLIVEISAKSDKLKQGLASATSSVQSFAASAAKSFAIVGAIIATAVVGAFSVLTGIINRQAEAIDNMSKEAQKVGASFSEFQKLAYGADLAGVSTEQLSGSLKKLNMAVGEAQGGTGGAAEAFNKLGLSVSDLASMNVEDRFLAVSDALKGVTDKTMQTKLAIDIFGKSGAESLVFLNSNIRATSKEFEDLGLTITDQQAASVEAYNDAKTKLSTIWDGFLNQITIAVVPAFQKVIEYVTEFISKSGGMKAVAEQVAQFMTSVAEGLITAFEAVGDAIDWIGDKMKVVGNEIGGMLDRLHLVGNAVANLSVNPAVIGTLEDVGKARQTGASSSKSFFADLRSKIGGSPAANAAEFYKGSVVGQIFEDLNEQQKETAKGLELMARAAVTSADTMIKSSKGLEDYISGLQKSAGQSELSRILGLNDKKGETNPIARSDVFDELVRKIYQKGTTGAKEEFTGSFNGQQMTVGKATTMQEDLAKLTSVIQQTSREGGNVIGMQGALDELTKFVNNKNEQKVQVDINVKADKGLIVDVTTSSEFQQAVQAGAEKAAAGAAKQMRG